MIFEFAVSVLSIFLVYAVFWLVQRNSYWKRNNVPYIPSFPLLGNLGGVFFLKENSRDAFSRLYNHPKAKNQPFVGINVFHKPAILVRDPELVKKVMVKDFNSFSDRHAGTDPVHDPIGGFGLFQLKNPTWKQFRTKISPVFTSGKMKQMFYMIEKTATELENVIASKPGASFDARELFSHYTVDVISLTAFGTEAGCLTNPNTSEFLRIAEISQMNGLKGKISFNAMFLLPDIFRFLKMTTFNPIFEDFLRKIFMGAMAQRLEEKKSTRNDLVDILIGIKKMEADSSWMTEDVLVAQAALFFVAGYETSSSTMSFVCDNLAKNPQAQTKLRQEIKHVLEANNGKLSYENVMHDLPYLGAVISETLRMYPILPFLDRECVVSEYSLEPFSSVKIPHRTPVIIPASAIQNDPEYFPNPEVFDPERFTEKLSNDYVYMPFGLGPHNCIGERLAWLQVKLGIINVLKSFRVELATPAATKMELDKSCLLLRSQAPIKVNFIPDKFI